MKRAALGGRLARGSGRLSRPVAMAINSKLTMHFPRSPIEVSLHTRVRGISAGAQSAIIAVTIVLAAMIVWTFGRGLELTDEAFYVLTSIYPHDFRFFFTPTQWISGPLWQMAGGLAGFRAIGWLVATVSALALGIGAARSATFVARWPAPPSRLYQVAVAASTIVSAWLYGAILPFSPSYNLLGAGGAYAAFGLFLLSIDCENRWRVIALAAGSGICLGVAVLSKFSAGVAAASLIVVLHALLRARHTVRLRAAVVAAVALVATLAIVISVESSFSEASREFLKGLELTRIAQGNETAFARLLRGGVESWQCLQFVVTTYWGPLTVACIALLLRNGTIGCLSVGWLIYGVISQHAYVGGMDVYQTQSRPLVAAMALGLILTLRVWIVRWRLAVLAGGFLTLPFAIAIGTGNPMPFQIVLALASWGALTCVLAFGAADHELKVPAIALAVAFTIVLATQIASSGYRAPYRLAEPMQAQRIPVDLGKLGVLKVDPETERFIGDVRSAWRRCGLQPHTPYLGVYGLSGVALVVDAVPVATPWLFSKGFADAALNGVGDQQLKSASVALLLMPNGARPALPDRLQPLFPSAYRFCGVFSLPFDAARAELWVPVAAAQNSSTSPSPNGVR